MFRRFGLWKNYYQTVTVPPPDWNTGVEKQAPNRLSECIGQVISTLQLPAETDQELLQRFVGHRDEAAFAAVVRRHGPMVLRVALRTLQSEPDAEDVFQATFLVLSQKAHSLRRQESLGSWLYGIAYRLALKTKATASERRNRHRRIPAPTVATPLAQITVQEAQAILDDEISRLPEKLREPVVLCCLEGLARDEAARQIGCPASVLKSRLEQGRERLRRRLIARGLSLPCCLGAFVLLESAAGAAVPPALIWSTTKAASAVAAGQVANTAVAAKVVALSEGVLRAMLLTKIKIVVISLVAGMMLLGGGMLTYRTLAAQGDQRAIVEKQPAAPPKQKRVGRTFAVTGIVTDAKDKPLDGVVVNILRRAYAKDAEQPRIEEFGMTKTNSDGRFEITALSAIWDTEARSGFLLKLSAPGFSPKSLTIDKTFDPEKKLKIILRSEKEEVAAREHSANNLKEIGLAMHNIHSQTKSLPARAIYSKDGKTPLLSWRVTILPHLGHAKLHEEFKLDEPWDSAHNKKLIPKMPKLYAMADATDAKDGETFYQVVFGPGTLFDGSKTMRFQDIKDGTANTLLVVEAKVPVVWTRPDDLQLPKDKDTRLAVGGLFTDGFNVLLCEATVRFVPHDVPVATFRALITPAARD